MQSQRSPDPFTGIWILNSADSRLGNRAPQRWIQTIEASQEAVRVDEEIVLPDGLGMKTAVAARFDGKDYPVQNSPLLDTIAYTRADEFHISGIGRKAGAIILSETASVSGDRRTLTLTYRIHPGNPQPGNCVAVFRRRTDS